MSEDSVSFVGVTDVLYPCVLEDFGGFDRASIFKQHAVLDRELEFVYASHHRYEVRRGLRLCSVERVDYRAYQAAWRALYAGLVTRHSVAGVANFSPYYFDHLANVPGLELWVARVAGEVVAAQVWLLHEDRAYYHLSAANPVGYRSGASYALMDTVLSSHPEVRLFDLGANAGSGERHDGLARFKAGFANQARPALLLGKIMNPDQYALLTQGIADNAFFPAYRA